MVAKTKVAQRTIVITGGSSGLGFEAAAAVLGSAQGWHVVLASHDEERTAEAAERLNSRTGNSHVTPMALDLASLDSVRAFVDSLSQRTDADEHPPLHAIVCNAAVQRVDGTVYTEDGFEATFGVNHLGHFLLVNLLLPHLSAPGRVIFLGGAGTGSGDSEGFWEKALDVAPPRTDFENARELAFPDDNPDADAESIGTERYSTSKLANVITAYELDRRVREAGVSTPTAPITSNAFNPGLMPGTGLARDRGSVERFLWNRVLPVLRVLPSVSSPVERGHDLAHLVTDPSLENASGVYFEGRKVSRSHPASYDEELASTLWEESAELVGLEEATL